METILSLKNNIQKGSIDIPSGYHLREIIQIETSGNKVTGGIKYGSVLGGDDIVGAFNLDANDRERLSIDGYVTPSCVYFDAVINWNSASADIYIIIGNLE